MSRYMLLVAALVSCSGPDIEVRQTEGSYEFRWRELNWSGWWSDWYSCDDVRDLRYRTACRRAGWKPECVQRSRP